jgi:hypothetical protein
MLDRVVAGFSPHHHLTSLCQEFVDPKDRFDEAKFLLYDSLGLDFPFQAHTHHPFHPKRRSEHVLKDVMEEHLNKVA